MRQAGKSADGAATQMTQKPTAPKGRRLLKDRRLLRSGNTKRHRYRALDESGPDELLDDWMTAGPAADLHPSK